MDVLDMRVPEYHGKPCASYIPKTYAVGKLEYIKDRKKEMEKIDVEINALKKTIAESINTESYSYKEAQKRLKKCYEIKQNCEASIVLAEKQIAIEKRTRTR